MFIQTIHGVVYETHIIKNEKTYLTIDEIYEGDISINYIPLDIILTITDKDPRKP